MKTHDSGVSDAIPPDDPTQLPAAFVVAFNSGNAGHLERLYQEHAVIVPRPGHPVSGDERAAATRHLLGFGLPIEAQLRQAYTVDDVALLIVDWSIQGTAPDGAAVDLSGTATDIAQRGADGLWRYVVDNPFGVK